MYGPSSILTLLTAFTPTTVSLSSVTLLLAADVHFGDLTLHLLASAAAVFILYATKVPLKFAVALVLLAGIGKELLDSTQEGNVFDGLDLAADVVGIVIGSVTALLFKGHRLTKRRSVQTAAPVADEASTPPKKPKVLKVRH